MNNSIWLIFGLCGQGAFSARFLVQWLISERNKKCTIPTAFWYFSVVGGLLLFIYALHKRDPVFILGQGFGLFIYLRNLFLLQREHIAAGEEKGNS